MRTSLISKVFERDRPLLEYAHYYLTVVGMWVAIIAASRFAISEFDKMTDLMTRSVLLLGLMAAGLLTLVLTVQFWRAGEDAAFALGQELKNKGWRSWWLCFRGAEFTHILLIFTPILAALGTLASAH